MRMSGPMMMSSGSRRVKKAEGGTSAVKAGGPIVYQWCQSPLCRLAAAAGGSPHLGLGLPNALLDLAFHLPARITLHRADHVVGFASQLFHFSGGYIFACHDFSLRVSFQSQGDSFKTRASAAHRT